MFLLDSQIPTNLTLVLTKRLLWFSLLCMNCGSAWAQDLCNPAATSDDIWEISSRASVCTFEDACLSRCLSTTRWECGTWKPASEQALINSIATDAHRTILYVHGNRTTQEEARAKAIALLRGLSNRSDQSLRLILFSWPSEKPDRLLPKRIADEKKDLIQVSGFYLAALLGRLPPDCVESIIGFSFGCAVASEALHLQAGGSIEGRCLPTEQQSLNRGVRVGFIAPAFERTALTRTGEYCQAYQLVDVLINLYNSSDPILKRFRFFDRDNPDAAGLRGLVASQHNPLATEGCIIQFDCSSIGKTHAEKDYYGCQRLNQLFDIALGKPVDP